MPTRAGVPRWGRRVPVSRCDRESRIPGSSRIIPADPGLKLLIDLTVRAPADAVTQTMPHSRPGLLTLSALCLSVLGVGLIAENLDWLADLRVVVQRSPSQFPSSRVVPPAELERADSVLSVYTEARYLHDPTIGLLANPTRIGRDWERPATVSYFRNGQLQFASNIGLRVHGGKSRTGSPSHHGYALVHGSGFRVTLTWSPRFRSLDEQFQAEPGQVRQADSQDRELACL